jgi:hypothetical protein
MKTSSLQPGAKAHFARGRSPLQWTVGLYPNVAGHAIRLQVRRQNRRICPGTMALSPRFVEYECSQELDQ